MEIKVGQKVGFFKVVSPEGVSCYRESYPFEKQFIGRKEFDGCVRSVLTNKYGVLMLAYPYEIKQIGTFTIKSIK